MIALAFFLLLVLLFLLTLGLVRDIWHPSVLVYIPWIVVFGGLFLSAGDFVEFELFPFLTVFLGVVSMSVGGLPFLSRRHSGSSFPRLLAHRISPAIYILGVLFVVYLPIFFQHRVSALVGELTLSGLRSASLASGIETGDNLPNRIMQIFLLVILLVWHNRVRGESHYWLLSALLVVYFGYMLVMGNKAYFIQLLLVIGTMGMTSRGFTGRELVRRGIVLAIFALLILWAMRAIRDGSGDLLKQVQIYLLSGVVIFQEQIKNISTDQWLVPLGQLSVLLRAVGLQNLPDQPSPLPFTYVGDGIEGNTATVFFSFYHCGGVFGVVLFSLLTGFFHSFLFARALRGSLRAYLGYLYLNSYLFITFFDLGYITMPLSTGFFLLAVFVMVSRRGLLHGALKKVDARVRNAPGQL